MREAKGNSLQINAKTFQGGIKKKWIKSEHIEMRRRFYGAKTARWMVIGGEDFFDCQRKGEDYQQVVKCVHRPGQFHHTSCL